jgi:hypothetical protein
VHGELAKNGPDDVGIEDIRLRSFFREFFDRLKVVVISKKYGANKSKRSIP